MTSKSFQKFSKSAFLAKSLLQGAGGDFGPSAPRKTEKREKFYRIKSDFQSNRPFAEAPRGPRWRAGSEMGPKRPFLGGPRGGGPREGSGIGLFGGPGVPGVHPQDPLGGPILAPRATRGRARLLASGWCFCLKTLKKGRQKVMFLVHFQGFGRRFADWIRAEDWGLSRSFKGEGDYRGWGWRTSSLVQGTTPLARTKKSPPGTPSKLRTKWGS